MTTIYNFSAGPAVLPQAVLQQAAAEMLDWHGSGMSVMEMSHRGSEFMSILAAAQRDLRDLLAIPDNYKVLFLQGGAIAENAIIPMNLVGRKAQPATVDYINTGSWSSKSIKEAAKYCQVNVAASSAAQQFSSIPPRADWQLSADAAYVHICSNETIDGVEYQFAPEVAAATHGAPLVADMSSHILSRVIDVSAYGVIYGGAQKNIGPAGLTIVIVREDLLGHALPCCPSAFDWKLIADNDSMYNTPPTYAIYIAGLVFQWLKRQGGVAAMEQQNIAKAKLLYDYLDQSDFYENRIAPDCRSRMNVPFFLKDESLNAAFLAAAKERGLLQLKGHKSVGGMRASIYNAMPLAGVQALLSFMHDFALTPA
ncbi:MULTISPECIES: 3-phosphoserine/phosphohydroxythreonine transaminase [unclassified Undibacterium]|uniref:3-phosphoserine/phosphohydroxythreonine transaminase n=2 Tax=Pseudomonadota TaxID=1224 RepID=UPI002AC8FF1B|nr:MULTISPECIES: 3-phosphoserine/phosphohydroxythreonine transaminase [unclassified Undibacterium]MEB0139553.1 3-phosphoserine/phosphohydroxythreonine transaminase [Undibacterium sp. CCC2.1]MEB0172516.1 3-phosphoserine/phosphohydroxythreonine transaminase [Undibacterium sp. CCC1.1]MEB0176534.1 3-phosphoserine/phosphohydroxythreonine transaminase [Undibacterium sp. CCC3.4]MEB0215612.1 3-phosphoserine/phosphohydroxythreonine transaminase [Undibacterium sp. 5I2]WPX43990.1 3-phosphoserine/phosphoh